MEACPARQASAALHSEFVRTLGGERLTAAEDGLFWMSGASRKKTEADPPPAPPQPASSLAGAPGSGKDDKSFVAKADKFFLVKDDKSHFRKRSDLMAQGCASSRLQAAYAAATRQVTNR